MKFRIVSIVVLLLALLVGFAVHESTTGTQAPPSAGKGGIVLH